MRIGQFGTYGGNKYVGYIDNLRITNGTALWTSNFNITSDLQYENIEYPTVQPYYVTTTDNSQIDLTGSTEINSATITAIEPTNTSIKGLVSFDGRSTWEKWNGSSWNEVTSSYTDDLCEGGIATASSIIGGAWPANNAFDNNTETYSAWYSAEYVDPDWIKYDFGLGNNKTIEKYILTSHSDAHPAYSDAMPVNFIFQGSNNDIDWEDLNTQTNQVWSSPSETKEYLFSNSTSYRYYRIYITTTNNAAAIIGEIEMMEQTDPLDTLQTGNTVSEIQTGLTNLTITDETTLDFAFDLATTDSSVTPSIDQITVNFDAVYNVAPTDPTLNNFNNGNAGTDNTPTFDFDLNDADTDDEIRYQIQIDNNSDFLSPEQDFLESGYTIVPRAGTTFTASPLSDGTYYWRVRAFDDDGLESNWSEATTGFVVDTALPSSTIKYPSGTDFKRLKKVPYIVGSAVDSNGSGIDNVIVSIKDNVTAKYYTGTGFTADTETWVPATGTSNWRLAAPTWSEGVSYTIRSRATDNAGNQEHTDSATFIYDTVNGSEGSIYVSNPAYMNNSNYEIFYPTGVAIPNGGELHVDFPDEYRLSPWLEEADLEITSDGAGEITSTSTVIDRVNKQFVTTLNGAGVSDSSLLTFKVNNLKIHNPSVEGDYDLTIGTYGVGGAVELESGSGTITIVRPYEQVELNIDIQQALQLSVDSGAVLLSVDPDVQLGQNWAGTGGAVTEKTDVTVMTNAESGYNLMISLAGNTATGSAVLDGTTNTGNQITSTTADRVAEENNFSFALGSGSTGTGTAFVNTATQVSGAGLSGPTNTNTESIYYFLNVDYETPSDTYQGTVTYTAVGQF